MRVLAWSVVGLPVHRADREGHKYWDREDPFPCASWCASMGRLVPELQARRRCTLPGFTGTWGEPEPSDRVHLSVWMGRPRDYENHDYRPAEDIDSDGCPGGWARSRFAESFLRYRRHRTEGGGHDLNPLVHADTAPHVLEALSYYEQQESGAYAEYERRRLG